MHRPEVQIGLAVFFAVLLVGAAIDAIAPRFTLPVTLALATALVAVILVRLRGGLIWRLDDSRRALGDAVRNEASDTRVALAGTREEIEETRALVALQEPQFDLPLPWTGWSVPPRGVLEILKTTQEFDAPTVVDCGSGVSTLHLARAVRAIGKGHVFALEQDAAWAEYIGRMLERNDLSSWVTLVVTPLKDVTIGNRQTRWYDMPEYFLPAGAQVDVLVVDGPTGHDNVLTRLGALPYFLDHLSERSAVFLDDTKRPEEQEICRIWREEFAMIETSVGAEHGMSKFTRKVV